MQRIINDPDNIVDEMLEGFLKTHSDLVERSENGRVVKSIHMEPGRTGVVTGGGWRKSGRGDCQRAESN